MSLPQSRPWFNYQNTYNASVFASYGHIRERHDGDGVPYDSGC